MPKETILNEPVDLIRKAGRLLAVHIGMLALCCSFANGDGPIPQGPPSEPSPDLLVELKSYPHKIVYESNRDGNWELYLTNADGSNSVNLTRSQEVGELYPKPSPD